MNVLFKSLLISCVEKLKVFGISHVCTLVFCLLKLLCLTLFLVSADALMTQCFPGRLFCGILRYRGNIRCYEMGFIISFRGGLSYVEAIYLQTVPLFTKIQCINTCLVPTLQFSPHPCQLSENVS